METRMDEKEFERLLHRARDGDQAALQRLFANVAGDGPAADALRALVRSVLPPRHPSRDVLQTVDVFQSAVRTGLRRFPEFRGTTRAELLAWLRAIARTKVGRALERKRPRSIGDLIEGQASDRSQRPDRDDPVEAAQAAEEDARLSGAIETLSPDLRVLFDLYLKRMRAAEIAAMLGVPAETIRRRKTRMIRYLREALGDRR